MTVGLWLATKDASLPNKTYQGHVGQEIIYGTYHIMVVEIGQAQDKNFVRLAITPDQ